MNLPLSLTDRVLAGNANLVGYRQWKGGEAGDGSTEHVAWYPCGCESPELPDI
jgi:hypothetical protein